MPPQAGRACARRTLQACPLEHGSRSRATALFESCTFHVPRARGMCFARRTAWPGTGEHNSPLTFITVLTRPGWQCSLRVVPFGHTLPARIDQTCCTWRHPATVSPLFLSFPTLLPFHYIIPVPHYNPLLNYSPQCVRRADRPELLLRCPTAVGLLVGAHSFANGHFCVR